MQPYNIQLYFHRQVRDMMLQFVLLRDTSAEQMDEPCSCWRTLSEFMVPVHDHLNSVQMVKIITMKSSLTTEVQTSL